jgi:hypothetical protein
MAYVRSSAFLAEGKLVIDVVFLCRWKSGEAVAADFAEIAAVRWVTASGALAHPKTPLWTRSTLVGRKSTAGTRLVSEAPPNLQSPLSSTQYPTTRLPKPPRPSIISP